MRWTGNPSVHLAFEITAYFAGAIVYTILRRRNRDVVPDRTRMLVLVGAAAGAAVGSRLLAWISEPAATFFEAKSVVGGLLGGLAGVEITKKIIGVSRSTGDLFVYPLITAMSIGRIGCFLTGPADGTAGVATDLPWGVAIADGVRRHPVALYEIAFLLLLVPVVRHVRKKWREGDSFRFFLSSYLLFRLAVDFLKPFPRPVALGLTPIQWACVAGLTYYAFVFLNRTRPDAQRHTVLSLL